MITIINTPSKAKALAAVPEGYASTGYFRNRVPYDGLGSLTRTTTELAGSEVLLVPAADLVGKTSSTITARVRVTDANGILFSSKTTSAWIGAYQSGNAGSITKATVFDAVTVDGVILPSVTRDTLFTAIADGSWHILEITGVNLTDAAYLANGLWFSGYGATSGWQVDGEISDFTLDGVPYFAPIDLTTNVASPQSSSSGWATDWASAADNAALQTLIDGKHLVTFRGKAVMDDGGLFDDFFDDFFG